jgi:hypothetical protein
MIVLLEIVLLEGQTLSLTTREQDRSFVVPLGEMFNCAEGLAHYQIRHTSAAGFTMAWPGLQENASANSGMFTTTPLMR